MARDIAIADIHIVPAHFLLLTLLLYLMQKFSFQAMENARFKIAADRTAADPEDPDHWDKLPRSTRAAAAMGKGSSPRHFTQGRGEGDSDEEILTYYDPMPLAYAFPTASFSYAFPMPSSAILDDMVVNAAPLNQGPPSTGGRAGRKRGVKPQPDTPQKPKRQKVGAPIPKKQRPVASG
jgi:hypothetical protein